MIIDPKLEILIPDPGSCSEAYIFASLRAHRRKIIEWQEFFCDPSQEFLEFLQRTYSPEPNRLSRTCVHYSEVLQFASEKLGSETLVWLIRCPLHSISAQSDVPVNEREFVAIVAQRNDDSIRLFDSTSCLEDCSFSVADHVTAHEKYLEAARTLAHKHHGGAVSGLRARAPVFGVDRHNGKNYIRSYRSGQSPKEKALH